MVPPVQALNQSLLELFSFWRDSAISQIKMHEHRSHTDWTKRAIDEKKPWKTMYPHYFLVKLTTLYPKKLVTKNHTCASRKIAQVRTAAVVSWPAISIVIRSSLSCQESIGRHDFKIIHAKMMRGNIIGSRQVQLTNDAHVRGTHRNKKKSLFQLSRMR